VGERKLKANATGFAGNSDRIDDAPTESSQENRITRLMTLSCRDAYAARVCSLIVLSTQWVARLAHALLPNIATYRSSNAASSHSIIFPP
jgi:hypothetical protein